MKIASISFSGLKGACRTFDSSLENNDSTLIRMNYYPFKDESAQEVDKFVRNHSCGDKYPCVGYPDDYGVIYNLNNKCSLIRKVDVKDRLPFSRDEFNMYKLHPDILPMQKRIEIKVVLEEIEREKSLIK